MLYLMKRYSTQLTLLSIALTLLFGVLTPSIFEPISFLGDLFINLLKLFALPLICSALVAALGTLGNNLSQLKSLARNALSYMFISEIMAVIIALVLFNLFKPGVGLNPDLILHGKEYIATHEDGLKLSSFILSVFPSNFFESLAKFDLLPAVIFSIMFGVGCSFVGEKAKPVVNFAIGVREVATTCLHGVMLFAPVGIFALVGSGVSQAYLSGNLKADFMALLNFVFVLFIGLFLHALWQLILVVVVTRQNPLEILKKSMPVFTTAFGTSSSVATLPIAMQTADQLKSKPTTTRFMLPLSASINIGGMMMYEVAAALFFSQMLGLDLSLWQQLMVALACILGGMAEGGIPETSMVSLVVVFKIVNVPLSAISILLPLDRIIDRVRTMVNIFGNMCGVIVVSNITHDEQISESTVPVSSVVVPNS
jgi:Na+/H+-dicarboxylate symporter